MNTIDPEKTYSLNEIAELGVIGKHRQTVHKKILKDMLDRNVLKTKLNGRGTLVRYHIKGENLIRYMNEQGG